MIEKSENINELSTALAKAQGKFTEIIRESVNPFFKKKYADLATILNAVRPALSENGLSIVNGLGNESEGRVEITCLLLHASGQWIKTAISMLPKDDDPQSAGSAITYGRRYLLSAMLSVASEEDDDGNHASIPQAAKPKPAQASGTAPKTDLKAELLQNSAPATEPVKPAPKSQERGKNRIAFDTIRSLYAEKPDTDEGKKKFKSFMEIYLAPRNCTVDDLSDSEIGIVLKKMKGE